MANDNVTYVDFKARRIERGSAKPTSMIRDDVPHDVLTDGLEALGAISAENSIRSLNTLLEGTEEQLAPDLEARPIA